MLLPGIMSVGLELICSRFFTLPVAALPDVAWRIVSALAVGLPGCFVCCAAFGVDLQRLGLLACSPQDADGEHLVQMCSRWCL